MNEVDATIAIEVIECFFGQFDAIHSFEDFADLGKTISAKNFRLERFSDGVNIGCWHGVGGFSLCRRTGRKHKNEAAKKDIHAPRILRNFFLGDFDHLCYVLYLEAVARKKISTTVYLTEDQVDGLRILSEKTKVPVAEYIRMGIDLILEKHQEKLPGQMSLFDDDSLARQEPKNEDPNQQNP